MGKKKVPHVAECKKSETTGLPQIFLLQQELEKTMVACLLIILPK